MPKHILYHTIWGAVLVVTGIAVFFRIPQVVPQLKETYQLGSAVSLLYFSLYLLGVLLISGGLLKIARCLQAYRNQQNESNGKYS